MRQYASRKQELRLLPSRRSATTSTINEWLKKAKQNNLTAENLRTLSEQDIEEILWPRSWSRQNIFLPDYEDLLVKTSAPKMTVPGTSHGTIISVSRNNFDLFRVSGQTNFMKWLFVPRNRNWKSRLLANSFLGKFYSLKETLFLGKTATESRNIEYKKRPISSPFLKF